MQVHMKINSHIHLFTLQNVLSRETIRAMGNRLRHKKVPEFIIKGIEEFISGLADKPVHMNEDQLLSGLVKSIISTDVFKEYIRVFPDEFRILNRISVDGNQLSGAALRQILDIITSVIESKGDAKWKVSSFYQLFRIATKPHTTDITDHYLQHLNPEDTLIALMMDIHGEDKSERDRWRFIRQMNELKEASLQRPGHIFPFFAVNPKRSDHFELMVDALENQGFAGIKLYPSLGYRMSDPKLHRVFEYCSDHDIPIMTHCNDSGFYIEDNFREYCHPDEYKPVLQEFDNLKICFAHFGGCENFFEADYQKNDSSWAKKIVDLMDEYPNVYADISFHTDMMEDSEKETLYFKNLTALLNDPHRKKRVLFGTDSWLLRLKITDELYWIYFEELLSTVHFKQITEKNPKAFLGLEPVQQNMELYIQFFRSNKHNVGDHPAPWLKEMSGVEFKANRDDPLWKKDKASYQTVYGVLHPFMSSGDKRLAHHKQANIRMDQLKFWKNKYRNPKNFNDETRGIAKSIIDYSGNSSISQGLNGKLTKNEAENTILAMLQEPEITLRDLVIQLETMHTFKF